MYKPSPQDLIAQRVTALAPLVKRIAHHLMVRLPANVEVDDLIQVGLMGLMEAAQHFDEAVGVQFETFAGQRIRGAMLDELRQLDWLPRQVRRQLKEVESAMTQLEHQLGRPASESELAHHLGVPLADLQRTLDDGRGHQLLYLDDFAVDDDNPLIDRLLPDHAANPHTLLEEDGFRQTLIDAIRRLPEREQLLMSLYYEQELNLKEIGEVLGVTESRVSQLHTQAVSRLRACMREWLSEPRRN